MIEIKQNITLISHKLKKFSKNFWKIFKFPKNWKIIIFSKFNFEIKNKLFLSLKNQKSSKFFFLKKSKFFKKSKKMQKIKLQLSAKN